MLYFIRMPVLLFLEKSGGLGKHIPIERELIQCYIIATHSNGRTRRIRERGRCIREHCCWHEKIH